MATVRKAKWDTTFRSVAGLLSAGAALVSILSFMASRKTEADTPHAAGLAAAEVSRIELSPAVDTAYSLGDTLHLTTTAADAHGQALRAAAVHWSTDDPAIAQVDSTGTVVARAPGVTIVTVAIGGRVGRARIVVHPRLTFLAIVSDTVLSVAEGTALQLRVMGRDARGTWHRPDSAAWGGGDAEVATMDSAGMLRAVAPGTTTITVASAGLVAQRQVQVRPVPASLTLTGGAGQRAPAGQRLPLPVAVQVVSRSGRPVPNTTVRFDPSMALGESEADLVTTDSLGIASSHWTLGATPGRQRLSIEVAGIDSGMTVTAEADPVPGNTIIAVSPDSLAAQVGSALAEPLKAHVSDSAGVVLADVPVTWTALDGGAVVTVDARTDSLGVAQARWTLGPKSGVQRIRLQVGNPRSLPPVVVSATALAGAATAVELAGGDAQSGIAGSALKRAVVIRATDSLGNPVGGVPIRVSSTSGVTDSVVETGQDGRASVRWTLGESAGTARLVARLTPKGDSVAVTATAHPGAAKTIVFASAPSSGTAGRPLSKSVRIVVHDRYGNPVPKATVRFSVRSGKLTPAQGTTDSAGVLSTKWTLGAAAGKQSLTATIKSPAVTASHVLTAQAGPVPKPSTTTKRRTSGK